MAFSVNSRRVFIADWIRINTAGSHSVVELGAGFCDKLRAVSPSVKRKIAIDLHAETLRRAKYTECERIPADMRNYRAALAGCRYTEYDTVMVLDSLEHVDKPQGLKLLCDLQIDFKRILLMVPHGIHPQQEDATGLLNPYQRHLATWYPKDLKDLKFDVVIIPGFSDAADVDDRMMFATWGLLPTPPRKMVGPERGAGQFPKRVRF